MFSTPEPGKDSEKAKERQKIIEEGSGSRDFLAAAAAKLKESRRPAAAAARPGLPNRPKKLPTFNALDRADTVLRPANVAR